MNDCEVITKLAELSLIPDIKEKIKKDALEKALLISTDAKFSDEMIIAAELEHSSFINSAVPVITTLITNAAECKRVREAELQQVTEEIKLLRKKQKDLKILITDIDTSVAYGRKTGNYMPLLSTFGPEIPSKYYHLFNEYTELYPHTFR